MKKLFSVILIACLFIVCLNADSDRLTDSIITFAGDQNYPPYEFLDRNNKPAGFNIELTEAIADILGLEFEIRLLPRDELLEALAGNEIDLLMGWHFSQERAQNLYFSKAHNRVRLGIFKRKDDQRINHENDLVNKEVIVQRDEIMPEYSNRLRYVERIIEVDNAEDALRLLTAKKHDLALLDIVQGGYLKSEKEIKELTILSQHVFSQEYCYAADIDKREFILQLNNAIDQVMETGVYDTLHSKWIAPYTIESQNREILVSTLLVILIPLIIIVTIIFFWQWLMRIKVRAKADELAKELEAHKKTAAQLSESRNRYQNLVENLPEIVFETDAEGKILFVNNNFYDLFSYSQEKITNDIYLSDLFASEDRKLVTDLTNELMKNDTQSTADFQGLKKDGTSFPLRLFASGIALDKEAKGILGIIIDLTRQVRTEKTQKALYEISEAVHKAEDINELFSHIHRITANLMPADNFYIALWNDEKKRLEYPYLVNTHTGSASGANPAQGLTEYVFETGKELLADAKMIKKIRKEKGIPLDDHNAKIWLGIPLKSDTQVIGVVAVQDYISESTYDEQEKQILFFISEQIALTIERKRTSEQLKKTLVFFEERLNERTANLKQSEELFRTLAESSENIIMLFDRELRHLYVNPIVEKYTKSENYPGLKPEVFIGRTHRELGFPEDYIKFWEEALTSVFETGKSVRIEFQLPSGVWIDWHLVPEISQTGKVTHVITTAHDMTELKQREEEIKKLNTELEQRVIERTKQLQQEIRIREQAEKIQRTLYLISEAVSTTRDIKDLYKNIHKAVQELMPAENFTIALYDKEPDLVSFPYSIDEFDPVPLPSKPGKGLTEYVLRTGTAMLAKSADISTLIAEGEIELVGNMAKVWLGIPLKFKEEVTGVIMVQDYHTEETYNEHDKQVLTFVSEQINHAIERKEADYQNNIQRIYFEQLFNSNPAGIVMVDNQDRILACNESFTKIFGYKEDEILHKHINDLIAPDPYKAEAVELSADTQSGKIVEKETVRRTKSGKDVYVKIFGVPIHVEGKQVGIYGIYLNITDLQNALNSFFEEKEKLGIMLSSIADGVIASDINGSIVLINKIAENLTGWPKNKALGRKIDRIFHVVDDVNRKVKDNLVKTVLTADDTVHVANHSILIANDGSEHLVEYSAAPLKDRTSRLIGVILVFRDITERKVIEEELQKSAKLESIGLLAGGIAHDFNNILTALLGNITLARTILAKSNPKVDEKLSEAEKASVRAKDLTHQLLTFSRGGNPIKKTVSLVEVIKEASTFATHGSIVNCQFTIADDLMNVEADLGQISQVINNMIINSVQAMPNGGVINIRAENARIQHGSVQQMEAGQYVKLTIADTGIGIARSQLSKVFDPFYTTKKNGSGLGLATSYNIIRKHDGYLTVDSTVGVGTTITFYLPASEKDAVSSKEEAFQEVQGKGEILLMDDDLVLIEVVTEMLNSLGYHVTPVHEGRATINKYKEMKESGAKFDVVILDLTIPGGMGGKDTVKEILAYDPEAVCIVSSGYSSDPIMSDYITYGFKAVLTKPYSLQQLGTTLKKIMS
jgi:PAS domain S-box-containing protein